ncbi:MAG: hypothetical protein ACRDYU_20015 [Actinomycetes bacterium]
MQPLCRSARLATWGTAALRGHVSPDLAAAQAVRTDAPHRVTGLADEPDPVPLTVALHRLGAAGAPGLLLVLPVPGDAAGLPGPTPFNAVALDAGEAVLAPAPAAVGLVPEVQTQGGPGEALVLVQWAAHPLVAVPAGVPAGVTEGVTLAESERLLQEDLGETAEALDAMDVARWRPEASEALGALRAPVSRADTLPPGYGSRAQRVLALARRLEAIVELALQDPGGAVASTSVAARTDHLRALGRRARHAQVAACNSWADDSGG